MTVSAPSAMPFDHRPGVRYLRRHEQLTLQADEVWEIESGFLRSLTWDETGNVTTLGIWGPGDQISAAFSVICPLQTECITPISLRKIGFPQSLTSEGLATFEQHSVDLNHALLNRAQRTEELLQLLQIRCTKTRLQAALQWLTQRFGSPVSGGALLPLRLTHQELADLIGSTRVTVTRFMNQLRAQGKIQITGRQLFLPQNQVFCPCPNRIPLEMLKSTG